MPAYSDEPYHDTPPTPRDGDAISALGVEEDPDDTLHSPAPWSTPWSSHPTVHRLETAWGITKTWVKGPQPSRPWRIVPLAEKYQTWPIRVRDHFLPTKAHKIVALLVYYAIWLVTFSLVLRQSAFTTEVPGYGTPSNIGCLARFWYVDLILGSN
jgi:hypothetical protein